MKSLSLSLLSAALLVPLSGRATITLDEALARTATDHPRLRAQASRLGAAQAFVERAGYAPNPVLNVTLENFAGTGVARSTDILEGTVEYTQTIERGGKRERRTAVATAELDVASAEGAVTLVEIAGAATRDYVTAVVAARRLAIAETLAEVAEAAVKDADARYAAGDASAIEPARAQAALAIAVAEVARRQSALEQARGALASHWAGDAADAVPRETSLQIPDALPDAATWRARLEHHPRLALETARLTGRRAAVELEQANATTDVGVSGGVRYLRESSDAAFVASFSLPLPIRHRNQAGIRAAQQALASTQFEASATERELRTGFTSAWQELGAAHTAARQLRERALPAAANAVALLRRARQAGQATQFEVIEAERVEGSLRRELLDQEAAYASALVRLEILIDPTFSATRQLLASP